MRIKVAVPFLVLGLAVYGCGDSGGGGGKGGSGGHGGTTGAAGHGGTTGTAADVSNSVSKAAGC